MDAGEISARRMDSYRHMVNALDESARSPELHCRPRENAQERHPHALPLLIEPEEFAEKRDAVASLLVVDVSSPDAYRAGHIPGALHLPPGCSATRRTAGAGPHSGTGAARGDVFLPGLTPDHHVVAYDDEGGGWAGRLLWTLEAIGHTNYSYLNGGIHAWRAAGLPEETDITQPNPSRSLGSVNDGPIAEVEDILPRLEDSNFAIWDARSAEEHQGLRSGSARAGQFPAPSISTGWS